MDYDIKPEPTTSLSQMLDFGLQKYIERYVLHDATLHWYAYFGMHLYICIYATRTKFKSVLFKGIFH